MIGDATSLQHRALVRISPQEMQNPLRVSSLIALLIVDAVLLPKGQNHMIRDIWE